MTNSPNRTAALVGAAVYSSVSWLSAARYVVAHDGFGSGDLGSFAFWSILAALVAYPILRLYDRRAQVWGGVAALSTAAVLGLLTGGLTTLALAVIVGPWFGAFSFPVLLCWLGGGLAGFVACALVRRPRFWPVALPTIAVSYFAIVAVLDTGFAPPADILVHAAPDVTNEQVSQIWRNVLERPSPTGVGSMPVEGIQTISRFDKGNEVRLRVRFHRRITEERRAAIITDIVASPLVARTSDFWTTHQAESRDRRLP